MRESNRSASPRGQGNVVNVVSAEFNSLLACNSLNTASVADFREAVSAFTNRLEGKPPTQWEFGG